MFFFSDIYWTVSWLKKNPKKEKLKMREIFFSVLLFSCLALGLGNRVYVHPFSLFALGNVSCEVIQSKEPEQVDVVKATPIGLQDNTEPDIRDLSDSNAMENSTQRKDVLAELQNTLGLRMYKVLTRNQKDSNTLFSPVNVFGTLVTLYLGASKKTAVPYQVLLGINKESSREDCVYLIDGHKVLRTLQEINALIDGPRDELRTLVWSFITQDAEISKDFIGGAQDFSDASYTRSVDFSKAEEAEKKVNNFIQKTSDGDIKQIFQNLSSTTNFLFASSVHFKGTLLCLLSVMKMCYLMHCTSKRQEGLEQEGVGIINRNVLLTPW